MKSSLFILCISLLASFSIYAQNRTIQFGGANGLSYNPASISVQIGDEITWEGDFNAFPLQSVTLPAGAASFANSNGPTFTYKPTVPGLYTYKCLNHASFGMNGSFTVEAPTGIYKSNQPAKAIRIFPTRTENEINIDLSGYGKKEIPLSLEIYNAIGQKLQSMPVFGDELNTLKLSELNKGIYLLAVKQSNGQVLQVTRIVKE